MKLSRRSALAIHYVLDQLIPPILRDADWFMLPMFRLLFGRKAAIFAQWKQRAPSMSNDEFARAYQNVEDVLIERETCLNQACLERIQQSILGSDVLEVGAGYGYLAGMLSSKHRVTAVDIIVNAETRAHYPEVKFEQANIERLPFNDHSFDTVVCAHTLEHVQDLNTSVRELRRVTKQRLIIVTPMQRPYKYTFDLHLHFFPYPYSLIQALGHKDGEVLCESVGGDLFYSETFLSYPS